MDGRKEFDESGFSFVQKFVMPDKSRGFAVRYGAGLVLPLAAIVLMHALFPAMSRCSFPC